MTAIKWHSKTWALLRQYIDQKRVPHALLLSGAKGLGKYSLATQFAYSLLCSKIPNTGLYCEKCDSCLLIKADTHPDFILIKPDEDKTSISINQIRQLVADAYLKPQYDTYRVVLINQADGMTQSAANAFLKCLEEPTERTVFILITDKPHKLPATIVSRCQKLQVTMPESEIMTDWLKEQGIHENQETLLNLAKNSILTMKQITNPVLLNQRTECFTDWMAIAKHSNYPAIISEKWHKLPDAVLINWLISWVVDLTKSCLRINQAQLCNQDIGNATQELAQRLNLKGLYGLYDHLLTSRRQLETQTNFQMMIEEILVRWYELNEGIH